MYQDSTGIHADTVIQSPSSTEFVETGRRNFADTVLTFNDLHLSADSIEVLKNSKDYYYAKTLERQLRELQKRKINYSNRSADNGKSLFDLGIIKVLLWSLAILFVLFILYKVFATSGFFSRNIYSSRVNELSEETEVSQEANYSKDIEQAIRDRNYRLAVRYLYLQSLQRLSEKGLVVIAAGKTNYQYVYELNDPALRNDFADITRYYEFVWYGEFELGEESFQMFSDQCKQFNSRI